jgi:RHS repeat-associated protein
MFSTTTYYHGDHLGSTSRLSSYNGTPMLEASYAPFGEEENAPSGTGPVSPNRYKFTGLEQDAASGEAGLSHTWFRKYSSSVGRWLSGDPLAGVVGNPQSLNRYSYVLNVPTSLRDPLGLAPCDEEGLRADCHPLIEGGDPAGFGCSLDGISVGCGWVSRQTIGNVYAQCQGPCFGAAWSNATNSWILVQFIAGAGGATGYYRPSDLASGINEFNGKLYTGANWNKLMAMTYADRIEAQREALARVLAEQSGGRITYEQAYAGLSVSNGFLQGGNWNFVITDQTIATFFQTARPGSGLHFENGFVHLDSGSRFSFAHFFVDLLGGNIVWHVIPR